MRTAFTKAACSGVVLLAWVGVACAQKGGMVGSPFSPSSSGACGPRGGAASSPLCNPLLQQYELYRDVPFHLRERADQAKKWDKATAMKDSEKLIKELSLPCELTDAEHAGGGKVQQDGRMLDVNVYEVACRAGTGYFLVSQPPEKSLAISCFAADAARAADFAKNRNPDEFTCILSGRDVKMMAASVLKGAGTACDVKDYRWVGVSTTTGMEYSEVACTDGQGYVMELPKSGPTEQVAVVGCQDAVKQGVKCNLTAVTMPVTLETFRDALKEHAVDCAPAQMRYIGRETQGRRYVVELQCPQQPKGLVAFIPLEGNPKPFETLDCDAAASRAVKCVLTAKQ